MAPRPGGAAGTGGGSVRLPVLLFCKSVAGCERRAMQLRRGFSQINDRRVRLDGWKETPSASGVELMPSLCAQWGGSLGSVPYLPELHHAPLRRPQELVSFALKTALGGSSYQCFIAKRLDLRPRRRPGFRERIITQPANLHMQALTSAANYTSVRAASQVCIRLRAQMRRLLHARLL